MADNVYVIFRESQYLVDLPIPTEFKGTERKVTVTQMRCVFPGFSDSYVEYEVANVYNTSKNTFGAGDAIIRKEDNLPLSHRKCLEVMEELALLPYEGHYTREYIYIRYIRAEQKTDWVNSVKFLRTAIRNQSVLVQAKRFFYDATEYPPVPAEAIAYAADSPTNTGKIEAKEQFARTYHTKEDKQLLELAGFTPAANGIMYKLYEKC